MSKSNQEKLYAINKIRKVNNYEIQTNIDNIDIEYEIFVNNNLTLAEKDLQNVHVFRILANKYEINKDYENMKKYYLMAIDKGDSFAMFNLALYYESIDDRKNMKKYYLMAIDKGASYAMRGLAVYYEQTYDYENMKKYYLMAIDKGNSDAMLNLALYYERKDDYKNMKRYYLMAIDKGHSIAIHKLADYYYNAKNFKMALYYYQMANNETTCKKIFNTKMCKEYFELLKMKNNLIISELKLYYPKEIANIIGNYSLSKEIK